MEAELAKLEFNLGGVRDMDRLPDAVFVTDLKTEEIAVHEAARLRIPIIGLVDTNCDPTPVDYVIPGNDDAIRSCQLVIGTIGGAVEEGSSAWRVQEEKRIAEEMERRKKEEEERKKREEEEKARLEAEEAAKAAAEAEASRPERRLRRSRRPQRLRRSRRRNRPLRAQASSRPTAPAASSGESGARGTPSPQSLRLPPRGRRRPPAERAAAEQACAPTAERRRETES